MQVIDFYSYKGGAGRSVTTINTIPLLAREVQATKENPILLIDLDLDSAGSTYLLDKADVFKENKRLDIVEYFTGPFLPMKKMVDNFIEHPFLKHAVDVSENLGLSEGSVLFMGVNDSEVNKDYKIESNNIKKRLTMLKRVCKHYNFKAVVFDSASGNQEIAQLALSISTKIVTCMKATTQFRNGTFRYFNALQKSKRFKENAEIIVLPVAIPKSEIYVAGKLTYKEDSLNRIIENAKKLSNVNVSFDFINQESFGIPEIESFKWREKILHVYKDHNELQKDEHQAYKQYEKLARIISR